MVSSGCGAAVFSKDIIQIPVDATRLRAARRVQALRNSF